MDHPSGEGFSWDLGGAFPPPRDLEEVVEGYGVRYATVARIGELGFTAATLVGMTEAELDDMMATLSHLFRWDLLLGERYGLKAALRAERRRIHGTVLQQIHHHHVLPPGGDDGRRRHLALTSDNGAPPPPGQHYYPAANAVLDTLSQEGLSEEPVQQEREAAGSGGELAAAGAVVRAKSRSSTKKKPTKKRTANRKKRRSKSEHDPEGGGHHEERDQDDDDEEEDEAEEGGWGSEESSGTCGLGGGGEKQREHPFIVTEPGEVARAKKNGLDYLFHLYEQCRLFLIQVQSMAKEQGHKCPTKVTNQVFRYAKKVGASYINKPKMRHYVHCYALHCLDEEASNALRRAFKERGENVGAWRQACYKPLVAISARHAWDIDAVFNAHPRLAIWYVPTKLRQLCHFARSNAAAAAAVNGAVLGGDGMPPPPPPPPPPSMF